MHRTYFLLLNQPANPVISAVIEVENVASEVVTAAEAVIAKEEAIEEIENKEATEIASTEKTAVNPTVDKKGKKEDTLEVRAVAADDGFGLWL